MSGVTDVPADRSPLDRALARVGDRWSLLVVEALLDGPRRFNDLQSAVPGIAPNILIDRLRRLERERVVVSRTYEQRPPRSEYSLSEEGSELASVLRLLAAWGASDSGGSNAADGMRHGACGSLLEARWYCPTCARAVDENDATGLSYA